MKSLIKLHFITVFISVCISFFPWFLAILGIVSDADVLQYYSFYAGIFALVLSWTYLKRKVNSRKKRWIIFLLNPVIYYLIALLIILFMIALEPWSGFHLS